MQCNTPSCIPSWFILWKFHCPSAIFESYASIPLISPTAWCLLTTWTLRFGIICFSTLIAIAMICCVDIRTHLKVDVPWRLDMNVSTYATTSSLSLKTSDIALSESLVLDFWREEKEPLSWHFFETKSRLLASPMRITTIWYVQITTYRRTLPPQSLWVTSS